MLHIIDEYRTVALSDHTIHSHAHILLSSWRRILDESSPPSHSCIRNQRSINWCVSFEHDTYINILYSIMISSELLPYCALNDRFPMIYRPYRSTSSIDRYESIIRIAVSIDLSFYITLWCYSNRIQHIRSIAYTIVCVWDPFLIRILIFGDVRYNLPSLSTRIRIIRIEISNRRTQIIYPESSIRMGNPLPWLIQLPRTYRESDDIICPMYDAISNYHTTHCDRTTIARPHDIESWRYCYE